MRETRPSGSEGGEECYPLSLPLSGRVGGLADVWDSSLSDFLSSESNASCAV